MSPDAVQGKCVRICPSAVADLDIDGVVGRGSHGHEVSKTSKTSNCNSDTGEGSLEMPAGGRLACPGQPENRFL